MGWASEDGAEHAPLATLLPCCVPGGKEASGPRQLQMSLFLPNREFSKEPELMPKTPSQKNRRKKKRISYVQDENRDPIRKR